MVTVTWPDVYTGTLTDAQLSPNIALWNAATKRFRPVAVGDGVTDDTSAVFAAFDAASVSGGTVVFDAGKTYRTTRRYNITASNVTIEGNGSTILFQPTNPVVDDRALAICGTASAFRPITGAIAIGAKTFTATNAGDVVDLVASDWLIVQEMDAGVGDVYVVDWVQVLSVAGSVVTVQATFRTAFPGTHGAVRFRRVTSLVKNVMIRNLTVVTTATTPSLPCLTVGLAARQITIQHCMFTPTYGNPMTSYLCADLSVLGCRLLKGGISTEFAATVDLAVQSCLCGTLDTAPVAPALTLDFGTGFFTVMGNRCLNAGNIGMQGLYGIHDGVLSGNVFGWTDNAGIGLGQGLAFKGATRVACLGNTLIGGVAGSGNTGIGFQADTLASPNVPSTGNVIAYNVITGFTNRYAVPVSAFDTYAG